MTRTLSDLTLFLRKQASLSACAVWFLSCGIVNAEPIVMTMEGTLIHGETLSVYGSDFGSRRSDLQEIYDDFESGDVDPNWTDINDSEVGGDNQRHARSAFNARGDFVGDNTVGFTGGQDDTHWFVQYWFQLGSNWVWGTGPVAVAPLGNVKYARFWSTSGSESSNGRFAFATYGNSNTNTFFEEFNTPSSVKYLYPEPRSLSVDTWYLVQIEYKDSTSINSTDAEVRMWWDGEKMLDYTGFSTRDTTYGSNYKRPSLVGMYNSWGTGNIAENTWLYLDDVYISNSWARVEIGDSPNYNQSTHRELQKVLSWTPDRVQIALNLGSFENANELYLFVVDPAGNVSSGFSLCPKCPKPPLLN